MQNPAYYTRPVVYYDPFQKSEQWKRRCQREEKITLQNPPAVNPITGEAVKVKYAPRPKLRDEMSEPPGTARSSSTMRKGRSRPASSSRSVAMGGPQTSSDSNMKAYLAAKAAGGSARPEQDDDACSVRSARSNASRASRASRMSGLSRRTGASLTSSTSNLTMIAMQRLEALEKSLNEETAKRQAAEKQLVELRKELGAEGKRDQKK
eukprot:g3674.t1